MNSQNEYYYKTKIEAKMEEFIDEELSGDHDLGYLSDNLSRLMTDAAWNVLATAKDLNDTLSREKHLK